jgi:capsular polysaccharide biosynthesis protein
MQQALDAVNAYATGKSQSQLLQDPKYQTLVVDATTAINYYLMIENQARQAQLKQSAIPAIRQATFRVVDAPSVSPKQLDLRTPALKYAFAALGATAVVEILLVYLIGLRDPRVRSGDEVRKRLGIPYLGSTPSISSVA